MQSRIAILGAGMTGLAAGVASGHPIYEAEELPGGICGSYYRRPGMAGRLPDTPVDGEAYRFEVGGGHWIHSGDAVLERFIRSLAPVRSYARQSSVYFPDTGEFVPYPLQNHLRYLPPPLTARIIGEIVQGANASANVTTLQEWLHASFGPTLCRLFFDPFHERYTAGLWKSIAPQDGYKSPGRLSVILQGAFGDTPPEGYNTRFMYPLDGLGALAQRMAALADVHYRKRVVKIDVERKTGYFADGSDVRYDALISTLPLNVMTELTGVPPSSKPDPYTSVLVLNIGAVRGPRCPKDHWVYIPGSSAGFHRVGFYSNVDRSFLPASARNQGDRVSVYVEVTYGGGQRPGEGEVARLSRSVVDELQAWEWLREIEVVDPTWIDVAYTWSWPMSPWRDEALRLLEAYEIYQVGRYARWASGMSQGIAHSMTAGFAVGAALARG